MTERIRTSEIFGPTIQGEGPLIGRPTVFVRTAGCDYRCSWCDTLYAVLPEFRDEWTLMSPSEILARVDQLAANQPVLISLSGGNPALQPLDSLITLGRRSGYSFAMETQGSVAQPWFANLDWLILSPKPPSSGMAADWNALDACIEAAGARPRCVLKIVVFDEADYGYARTAASRCPNLKIYLQVGNPAPLHAEGKAMPETADIGDLMNRLRWLAAGTIADRWFDATVLPQLHVLAWGNKRGV
ncbi:MAG TPA: 7-carboxy-7-deazaguanine synthase QueE [Pseudolabrys sp.]|nr:7-carboxy-7-deazaguanine synthase QueE [Pseudolabrys sp.]